MAVNTPVVPGQGGEGASMPITMTQSTATEPLSATTPLQMPAAQSTGRNFAIVIG